MTPGTGFAGKAANVLSCGSIVGLRFPHTATAEQPIAYATGASWDGSYPSWIAGPVVGAATTVVIRFRNGAILRLPNVSPPQSLGRLRWFGPIGFYAAPLPTGVRIDERPLSLAGLDSRGGVVACLVPGPADDHGWSPLADCAGSSDR